MRRIKIFFGWVLCVAAAAALSGCGLKQETGELYQVDLEVWGVFDDSDMYVDVFNEYRRLNPYVREINYRKMSPESYKEDLLDALAAGKGPDIFMIRNSWRGAFEDKIAPAPDNLLKERSFREALVDVAAEDFLATDGKIYGIPLSVDSLALYYNKDLLNAAGITAPPATWEDLLQMSRRLSRVDQFGNITQSGVALGTAYNINRSTDVLTALLFQLGSNLRTASPGQLDLGDDNTKKALEFYTQFARIGSAYYSWNPRLHYSIDAFYEGTLAMMANYSWHYATIKQKNAKLNIGIAPLPQFSGTSPVNVANYWGFAVSKYEPYTPPLGQPEEVSIDQEKQNYLRVHEAWQLLSFLGMPHPGKTMTLQNGVSGNTKDFPLSFDPAEKYLERTKKPAARRDLVAKQQNDVVLAPFASGNLIARNWYQGNPEAVEAILAELIDDINRGTKTVYEALQTTGNRINLLIRR